jgi:ERCC4-type nuclease
MSLPRLILDVRERGLAAALTQIGVPFTTAQLDVGDLVIQDAEGTPLLVAERKSFADFAASNTDGRYREQRARLMATRGGGVAVLYILEGSWTGNDGACVSGRVTEGGLRRLTSRLVLRYSMPVLCSASITGTAQWCRTLLAQLSDDPTVFHPEGDMATATMAAMTGFTATLSTTKKENRSGGSIAAAMLGGVPGLGAKRIEGVLQQASIAELATMTAAEISGLVVGGKRLGDKLGATIQEALSKKNL